jgi:hypothetical protein
MSLHLLIFFYNILKTFALKGYSIKNFKIFYFGDYEKYFLFFTIYFFFFK